MAYETVKNDHEMENIEVDEPIIQKRAVGSYVKQEMTDDASDPLYTEDYLDASPKRKSPTKKQSTIQNGEYSFFGSSFLHLKDEYSKCCWYWSIFSCIAAANNITIIFITPFNASTTTPTAASASIDSHEQKESYN